MKSRWAGVLMVCVLMGVVSGCAASKNYKAYRDEADSRSIFRRSYDVWHDWFADLSDIASLEFSAGEGFGVHAQPTKIFQVGGLAEDVMKVGFRNRGFGFYRELRKEGGLSWFYYRDMLYEPITGTSGIFDRPRLMKDFTIRYNDDRHWMDVGVEIHLIFFGTSVFVSPKQTLDFFGNTVTLPFNFLIRPVLNWTGIRPPEFDLCDDDTAAQIRKKHELELIKDYERFPPTELLDQLMRVPY